MKNERKIVGIVIIILIIGILIGLGVFSYNKYKNSSPKDSEKYELLDLTDKTVLKLFQLTRGSSNNSLFNSTEYENIYYKNDITEISKTDNNFRLLLTYLNLPNEYFESKDEEGITISGSNFKKIYQKIFGSIKYVPEDINYSCPSVIEYNKSNDIYTIDDNCGGNNLSGYVDKLIEARKYSDRIEIYEKVAFYFVDEEQERIIYTINDDYSILLVETSLEDEFNIDNHLERLHTYKYTFKLDGENYHFTKVTKEN